MTWDKLKNDIFVIMNAPQSSKNPIKEKPIMV